MKPTEQSCDTTQIDEYLAGHLGVEQQAEFEAHLTGCPPCRQRLEECAAERDVWDNARELLSQGHTLKTANACSESTSNAKVQPGIMVLDMLAPTDDPEMLGRLGEYEISGVVGVGGMGAVLRGFDKSLRRVVAIKVMAPHLAGSGPARARFQREARAAATITHDNIIDIHGVSEANDLPYIVMPFARGPSLQSRIDRSGPLTAIEVVRIGKQIASGLAAAHEQGLVHRDIKPANILLNEGIERLWITDFGVARAMDDASMTQTGVIAGTPQYMSPEQARGESVDHRSDLFSLGSVLYTACTGRAPFRSEAAYGILRRITDTDPRPIREINPDIPDWLCQIIGRLMAKHASDRFQTAAEVADLLEGCLAHLQQPTHAALPPCIASSDLSNERETQSRPSKAIAAGGKNRKERWVRSAIAGLVACLMLAGLGAVAWQATAPVDIAGTWKGEDWTSVSLSSVNEATGWYNGTFTDDEGNRGAIQLEWSRLQRRYNGRWKSGDHQSGSITLRAGDKEEVRGAVSADPESPIRANKPRLREFSWRRTNRQALSADSENLPQWRTQVGKPQSVTSPEDGFVVRLGEGIRENARIKKGDLIAVLAPNNAQRVEQLESLLKAVQQEIETHKSDVSSKERSLQTAKTDEQASKQRQASFEAVQREIVAGAEAAIAVEANKVEAAKAQLTAFKAVTKQLQDAYDRKKEVVDRGLVSREEVKTAEAKLEKAKASVAEAEARVRSATNEMLIKEKDRNAKRARAQVDIDDAKASVRNAQTAVAEAEAKLALAKSMVENAEKHALEIQQKLKQVERLSIFAPLDGYITSLAISTGKAFKQGDVLCLIWPYQAEPAKQNEELKPAADKEDLPGASSEQPSVLKSLPPRVGDTGQGLMAALDTASSIAKRIRDARSKLQAAKTALSTNPQAEALRHSLEQVRDEIAALEKEKATIMKLLQTRRDAANQLHQSQSDFTDQMVAAERAGKISSYDLIVARHSLAKAELELDLLNQLLTFYANIDGSQIASGKKAIIEILKKQIEKSQQVHDLQDDITARVNFAFERGNFSIDQALHARQALAKAKAELSELKLLLDHYNNLNVAKRPPDSDAEQSENDDH